jgi:zinc protease
VRGQVLSIIASNAQDPGHVAGDSFSALAFGDHPYGTSPNGTADSVTALTRQDMLDAKARVMARDRVYVAATGDITPAELGRMLDSVLGGLPATGAPMPPRATLMLKPGVHVTDFDTPQSVVIFGQPGLSIDNPDFFPAYVLNQLLGGSGFTARLMNEVREKRGLTYGIASYLAQMDLAETWQGSFASANEKVAEAIKVVKDEWARAASGDIAQSEVDAAKTYLTGSYPLRFDGNGPIADILVGMQMQGLPIGYVAKRNSYIEAVTLEDVKRVAKKWLKPDALQFVVAGKPVGLAASN